MDLNKDWSGIASALAGMILKTLAMGVASMAAGAVMTKLLPGQSLQEAWNNKAPAQIPETNEVPEVPDDVN